MLKQKSLRNIALYLFLVSLVNICFPFFHVKAETTVNRVSFNDIREHWAKNQIEDWTGKNLIGGYPDGTFQPENNITRAEFLTLLNRAFGYTEVSHITYSDVSETDWFAAEIAKAVAVGYIGGYPDKTMKPNQLISRQEVTVILARIFALKNIGYNSLNRFTDKDNIPEWSKYAVNAVVASGYMGGYPDGTFQSSKPLTRAEAISILYRAAGTIYNCPGTYGSGRGVTTVIGNVTISCRDITLRNTLIKGNLYLTEGIGDGQVILDNVQVEGNTRIGSKKVKIIIKGTNDNKNSDDNDSIRDRKAPAFIEGYPKTANLQITQFDLLVQANERGKAYFVVLSADTEAPSVTQVKAGQDSFGNTVADNRKGTFNLMTNREASITVTGLEPLRTYNVYIVAEDYLLNLQSVVTRLDVTTEIVAVTGVTLDHTNLNLTAGGAGETLAATVMPAEATNRNVTWESSSEAVATINANGIVTPIAAGIVASVPYTQTVTALVPTITHTGASVSPASGVAIDFTDSATYTVTAEDSSKVTYTVQVTQGGITVVVAPQEPLVEGKVNVTITPAPETGNTTYYRIVDTNPTKIASGTKYSSTGFGWITVPGTSSFEVAVADGKYIEAIEVNSTSKVVKWGKSVATDDGLNKVTSITIKGAGDATTVPVNETLQMNTTVLPANANDPSVTWSVENGTGTASISETGLLTGTNAGTVTVKATANDGYGAIGSAVITVVVPVTDITVTGEGDATTITTDKGTLQMNAAVTPAEATITNVTWSVLTSANAESGMTGKANINSEGLLTAVENGTVKVVATANDGSGITGELVITLSNQTGVVLVGVSWTTGMSTSMTRLDGGVGKTAGADFNSIYPWNEMKLCNVADDGTINAYIGDTGFKRDGTNGQVMVKIPKFYYKHTYEGGTHNFWVSEQMVEGFKLHPCFSRAGVEKDYILVGAYMAAAGKAQDGQTDSLTSITGIVPTTGEPRAQYRTLAQARGTGWNIIDALTRNAIALLYLVEYADTDCQATIGQGVKMLDDPTSVTPGGCDYLNGASGMASGINGEVSVSYRGIEDLWGYFGEVLDGLNIKGSEKQIYIADSNFADNTYTGSYTASGVILPATDGYLLDFTCSVDADWLLMPSAVSNMETLTDIPDIYFQDWIGIEDRIAVAGWYSASCYPVEHAGLFAYDVILLPEGSSFESGTRIIQIP